MIFVWKRFLGRMWPALWHVDRQSMTSMQKDMFVGNLGVEGIGGTVVFKKTLAADEERLTLDELAARYPAPEGEK